MDECIGEPAPGYQPLGPPANIEPGCQAVAGGYSAVDGSNDRDVDGIKDECEQILAKAFEPQLVFAVGETLAGREPHYTATLVNGYIHIGYLLSYYYDGRPVSHHGDSEFIITVFHPGAMAIKAITTSAHWGATFGWWFDETRTYAHHEYTYTGPRPWIYVSGAHHGNYNTEYRCDQRSYDDCDAIGVGYNQRAGWGYAGGDGIRPDNNIGSEAHPFDIDELFGAQSPDCTRSDDPGNRPGTECYFNTAYNSKFAGWFSDDVIDAGTTHYRDALVAFGLL